MLNSLTLLFVVFISTLSFGQDSKVFEIEYIVTKKIGYNSLSVSKYILNVDSSTYRYEYFGEVESVDLKLKSNKKNNLDYNYHIGRVDGQVDFHLTTFPYENYTVVDSLPMIDWKITKDLKLIGKFNCVKAVGNYRGRVIDAYFSTAIPIQIGPNNLNGLPGAIIYAETRDGDFKFNAKKIKKINRPERFTFYESFNFGDLTSMKKWLEDFDKLMYEVSAKLKLRYQNRSNNSGQENTTDEVKVESSDRGLLELYYEWQLEDEEKK